jgi:hypothetical protein
MPTQLARSTPTCVKGKHEERRQIMSELRNQGETPEHIMCAHDRKQTNTNIPKSTLEQRGDVCNACHHRRMKKS